MTEPFAKPATTFSEQVRILQERGMTIADSVAAEKFLSWVSYYRLTSYWLPFEQTHEPHCFQPGTTFEQVKRVYMADRELRLLMLDAIERIEVALRTQWAYRMGHAHGPHSYLDRRLAVREDIWQKDIQKLTDEVNRSRETFILHMKEKYSEALPPIWATCEVMSLGLLSSWYGNLKPVATRDAIARPFQIQRDVLGSWTHHLTVVRNHCAHHSRLWNRSITVAPRVPISKPAILSNEFVIARTDSKKLYNTLLLTLHLMNVISPGSHWRSRLLTLLQRGDLNLSLMGFPAGWETRPIWRGAAA
jgi:abortive infection bacteriophage resistance protein